MNEVEERLRREMAAAVQDVESPAWLPAAARKGGRRRANRRRVLLAAPATAAAVGAVGVASWGGWSRPGETSVVSPAAPGAPAAQPGGQEARQEAARAAVEQARALEAYFAAGYDYDDAVELGRSWNVEPGEAKVSAGADLLAGRPVPLEPTGEPYVGAPADEELVAYFGAGYGYADAVELGRLWNVEPAEAKTTAGAHLLAGEELPFEPVEQPAEQPVEQPAVPADDRAPQREAFFAAGYDYDDAVELGEAWNVDAWEAKALAGERLLAGGTLPVQP
ncbi:hypothetical protein MN205_01370 [Kineococcus sp. TRM81007]|uniref:hypothetical protein n=1 Tax=Kineococcus sp. TRM81007 TaxID=2925831 RepID=UPI001F56E318|nr:hypothetical protein [Kineococcus sp. TRM81007]MCI2237143.1 hypothetical protein [Kineococcus sp. TRM81007]